MRLGIGGGRMGLGGVLVVSSAFGTKGCKDGGKRRQDERRGENSLCDNTPILASNPTELPAPTSQASRASLTDRLSTAAAAIERILPAPTRNEKAR
jgi:hypothetical protein